MDTSSGNTTTAPQLRNTPEAPRPGHLQKFFPLYILGFLLWLTVGRIVLGSMGWCTFLFLLLGAPSLVIYFGLIYLIVMLRHKSPSPTFTTLFNYTTVMVLASGFLFGLAMGDASDAHTVSSILTRATSPSIESLSETIGVLFILMFVMSSFALLMICIFYRKQINTPAPTPPLN